MNIGRFLSLTRCKLDFANKQMIEACYPSHIFDYGSCVYSKSAELNATEFYEYVDPPIRPSYQRMSLKNKREQFYQHSKELSLMVEREAEYFLYLIISSLLKVLPLREIKKSWFSPS